MLAAHQTVQAQQKAVLPLETCSRQTDKRNLVQTRRWNAERVSDLPEVTGGHSTTDPISQTLLKIILIASILIVCSFWVLLPTPSLVMQDRDRVILDSSEDHLHWAWEEQPGLLLGAQGQIPVGFSVRELTLSPVCHLCHLFHKQSWSGWRWWTSEWFT